MMIGIMVSYEPDSKELVQNINSNLEELDLLILVENGSSPTLQNQIAKQIQNDRCILLLQDRNLGLGKAQNIGLKKGFELGGEYFLFLDDDSVLKKGSVKILKEELFKNPKLGIAACHVLHEGSKKEQKYWIESGFFYKRVRFTESSHKLEKVNTVISSGSLIPKSVIEKCGFMEEDYFIDYIDIEYCLRVRKNGYTISVYKDAVLFHKLGNTKTISVGNLQFHPTNHSPERRFYMIRNRIWTWRKYGFSFFGWFLIDLRNFFFDNLRVLLFEKDRYLKMKFFWKGLVEGFLKK